MNEVEILEKLISFPSVVGTPNDAIADWITAFLTDCGATVTSLPGPEGDRRNLFATIGPKDQAGYVLSGHMDVVPATEATWTSDPFRLRAENGQLFGRGTTDMKGFLAAALFTATKLQEKSLLRPIHFAFSYDEEALCRGVPHMIRHLPDLCNKPLGAIIGEPSGMRPVLAHKGKAAARVFISGRSGHSSRPDLGLNAIHGAARVLMQAVGTAEDLRSGPIDEAFEPPYSSLQVGLVKGGSALNIIADSCEFELECRAIAGLEPRDLLNPVEQAAKGLEADGYGVEWIETGAYPGLSLPAHSDLAMLLSDLTGTAPLATVSYGTEAGLFQQGGIDAIICGPGDIGRAHKPNEYLLAGELKECLAMLEALVDRCC